MTERWLDRPPFTAVGLLWPGRRVARGSGPAGDGPALRVVTANAFRSNSRADAWAAAVLALEPDVLCVQELTPAIDAALVAAGVNEALPGGCAEARPLSAGTGVWTSLPVDGVELAEAGYVLAAVHLAVGVTVASVHMVAPSSRAKGPRWWAGFDAVSAYAERTSGPLVIAGDWNATLAHTPLRELLGAGLLRDAHVDAERRFARTFPSRVSTALLDRVLVSAEIAVRGISERRLPGSDHRAVVAELVVTGAPARR